MKPRIHMLWLLVVLISTFTLSCNTPPQATNTTSSIDPLPSWNDGAAKKSILDFVTKTTKEGSADFIPPPERIACFDNDGTLWSEQPMYFQLAFVIDRIKAMAPQHPEWKTKEPFKSLLT